ITDGAYAGEENVRLAAEKNITLITTDLPGRDVDPIKGEFVLNDEGTRILKCPRGFVPKSAGFIRQSGMCTASFDREQCASCPYREHCRAKVFKRVAKVQVSAKQVRRAQMQAFMKTEEFKAYARLRNGVETIPSILRRIYHTDRMPVRGKCRSKFFFGAKVAALNFRKLLTFHRGRGNYAQNPLLAAARG
ncbi:MAG: transposase, partial [Lachnospiraceae bacterium]|nr:transposase [Lachnospiraceae bacterium]